MRRKFMIPSWPIVSDLEENPEGICPHCGAFLEMQQPDEDIPERLLGVCTSCKAWFLVEQADYPCLQMIIPGNNLE